MPLTKSRLKKGAKRVRAYSETEADLADLGSYRKIRAAGFPIYMKFLCEFLHDHEVTLSGRVKRFNTILNKLRTAIQGMDVTRMNDVVAYRIIVPTYNAQLQLVDEFRNAEQIGGCLELRDIDDYAGGKPHPHGYRAAHLIFGVTETLNVEAGPQPFTIEVQIRTHFQNLWSTMSESYGEKVKAGGGRPEVRNYLHELASKIQKVEEENPTSLQVPVEIAEDCNLLYSLMVFDKKSGQTVQKFQFEDFDRGIELLEKYEREEINQSKEIALISSIAITSGIELTHIRYHVPGGVPNLPRLITPDMDRPPRTVH